MSMPRRSKVIGAATLSHKGEVTCAASVTLLADAADHPSDARLRAWCDCPAPCLVRLPGSEPGAIARLRASLARHNQRQARHFEAEQGSMRPRVLVS